MARILIWDLETTHLKADFGTVLCAGYKWLGEKKIHVPAISDYRAFRKDPTNDGPLMKDFLKVYSQADLTITYFGIGFDRKYFYTKLLEHGLEIPFNIPMVDLFFTVKSNMALSRKSLGNVGYFLGLDAEKTPCEGKIWKRAMVGHAPSIKYVVDHCEADVQLLEEAYLRLRPLIRTHPRVEGRSPCRYCGSERLQYRGWALTSLLPKRKIFCPNCGGWEQRSVPKAEIPPELFNL